MKMHGSNMVQGNAQNLMTEMARRLVLEEVVEHGRKSNKSETASKSLADQKECCDEIAAELGIPVSEERWWPEQAGHGGDEWWAGGGATGIVEDTRGAGRTRPMLTKIIRGIMAGRIKCVVVYSLNRLWRSAAIAGVAIDIFAEYGCLLVDRNGFVDLFTAEGRQAVLQNAVHAQGERENAKVTSPRGVFKSRAKGKLVGPANSIGFRSVGGRSGGVRHLPEEHEVVRRIFRLFVAGENGSGPLNADLIAQILMDEGYIWAPDLHSKRAIVRSEYTRNVIYPKQINSVLRDVRYQGQQLSYGEAYDCPVFLYNGETIVPADLWKATQDKIKERTAGSYPSRDKHALSGRVRCGLCGMPMIRQLVRPTLKDGAVEERTYWMARSNRKFGRGNWCSHSLPCIREEVMDAYIDDVLAPLLVADIADRTGVAGADTVAVAEARVKSLQREVTQRQEWIDNTLPDLLAKSALGDADAWDEGALKKTAAKMRTEIDSKRAELRALYANGEDPLMAASRQLASIKDALPAQRRDALRSVIRWIAMIPNEGADAENRTRKEARPAGDMGSLVILTAWGACHTARMFRDGNRRLIESPAAVHGNSTQIRPALPIESYGGVADFPDPAAYWRGLERSFLGKAYPFDPREVTPGYTYGMTDFGAQEVEEIEICGDSGVASIADKVELLAATK